MVVVSVLGYVWYSYYTGTSTGGGDGRVQATDVNIQNIEARLSELRRLRDLKLDASLFTEEAFRELQLPVIPPPPAVQIGRPNPFLPF